MDVFGYYLYVYEWLLWLLLDLCMDDYYGFVDDIYVLIYGFMDCNLISSFMMDVFLMNYGYWSYAISDINVYGLYSIYMNIFSFMDYFYKMHGCLYRDLYDVNVWMIMPYYCGLRLFFYSSILFLWWQRGRDIWHNCFNMNDLYSSYLISLYLLVKKDIYYILLKLLTNLIYCMTKREEILWLFVLYIAYTYSINVLY